MKLSCADIGNKLKRELICFINSNNENKRSEIANHLYMFCVRIIRKDILVKGAIKKKLNQVIDAVLDEFSEYDLYYGTLENYKGILFTDENPQHLKRDRLMLYKKINRLITQL